MTKSQNIEFLGAGGEKEKAQREKSANFVIAKRQPLNVGVCE